MCMASVLGSSVLGIASHTTAMKVFIMDAENNTYPVVVDPTDTIEDLKKWLAHVIGVDPAYQELSFADWILHGTQTLVEANIQHRTTLHLREVSENEEDMALDGVGDELLMTHVADATPGASPHSWRPQSF